MSGAPAKLPIVDISQLESGGEAALRDAAGEVLTACDVSGFFYLSGHGISDTAIADIRTAARSFFAQADSAKREIAINQHNRGYLGPGEARMRGATNTDLKEVFFWGRDLPDDDPDILAGVPLCGPNRWPPSPEGFRDRVVTYAEAVQRAGDHVLRAFAVSLGAAPEFFVSRYTRPMLRGQLIHYPPLPGDAPADQFGVAPHSDFGCITLLLQETPGLEVLTRGGDWIKAPPIPGALIINIGDLLERWSNSRLPSTRHRVRNETGAGRYSVAMFYDPSPRAVIDPRDLGAEDCGDYPPVEAAEYILGRNKGSFAHYNPAVRQTPAG